MTDKIFSLAEDLKAIHRSRSDHRKRHHDDKDDRDSKKVKREKDKVADAEPKNAPAEIPADNAPKPSPGQLTAIQVQLQQHFFFSYSDKS